MKKLTIFISLLLCMAMLCSCAPKNEYVSNQAQEDNVNTTALSTQPSDEPSTEPDEAAEEPVYYLESGKTPNAAQQQRDAELIKEAWREIWDIVYKYDWTTFAASEYVSYYYEDSADTFFSNVKSALDEMIPYIEAVLDPMWQYVTTPIQQLPLVDKTTVNEVDITNEEYVRKVLWAAVNIQGANHEKAKRGALSSVTLPESALSDFMRVCFIDYTDNVAIPSLDEYATYSDGEYKFMSGKWSSMYHYAVTDIQRVSLDEFDGQYVLRLQIVGFEEPDMCDATVWRVFLVKNDETDALGASWRIGKIVRVAEFDSGLYEEDIG